MKKFLENMIKNFLEKKIRERDIKAIYPSEIGFCIRRNWYLYTLPKQLELRVLKLFQAGSFVHNWFISVFLNSFQKGKVKYFSYEEPCVYKGDDWIIKGRYDDMIGIKVKGELRLFEIKSVAGLERVVKPSRHHKMQLIFYLKTLGLKKGWIVYVDRRYLDIKVFKVEFNHEIFNEIIKRATFLAEHLAKKKLPFPEAKFNSKMMWMCKWCPYFSECEKDFNPVKEKEYEKSV